MSTMPEHEMFEAAFIARGPDGRTVIYPFDPHAEDGVTVTTENEFDTTWDGRPTPTGRVKLTIEGWAAPRAWNGPDLFTQALPEPNPSIAHDTPQE